METTEHSPKAIRVKDISGLVHWLVLDSIVMVTKVEDDIYHVRTRYSATRYVPLDKTNAAKILSVLGCNIDEETEE